MFRWFSNLLGDSPERQVKRLWPVVDAINGLEEEFQALDDDALRAKSSEFRQRLEGGETLDDILPEAFAAVREASRRTIGLRHYDVQLIGGMVLHQGRIAEMRTGEGKTLVATGAAYLNALGGLGVHVITVNDYLAKRDVQWMGPVYQALGLTVASIQHESSFVFDPTALDDERFLGLRRISRQDAYRADITYGTNNEFGFDYLRDNMVVDNSQMSQRPLNFAVVDEVDNILIDEARTPLIISGQAEEATDKYYKLARLVTRLREDEDFAEDHKHRTVNLTESGIARVEQLLGIENLYAPENFEMTHYVENALKALVLFDRDVQYVVREGEVVIVDEFTGRLMPGRRYSEGLHQAIEAKEGVKVQNESVTLGTITFQNYFRMYKKLSGMTGTALTEQEEFHKIYNLDVIPIPTNMPMVRTDGSDLVYKTEKAKFDAVVNEIIEMHEKGRPVLVGTVSIEKSELLSTLLRRRGVTHEVLNAKYHEREANIIAQAGKPAQVTIATNMAGRGTDIILGGNVELMAQDALRREGVQPHEADPDQQAAALENANREWDKNREVVVAAGGLHIIGTERHESRRIDNQLRGRAGRQGDPGSSRFYVSLDDEIMKRFGGDRVKKIMEWAGMEEDVPIEAGIVSKSIESAQSKVEGFNFDIRKNVVQYDDVMNKQREVIYSERRKILGGADLKQNVLEMVLRAVGAAVDEYVAESTSSESDYDGLIRVLGTIFPLPDGLTADYLAGLSREEVRDTCERAAEHMYELKEEDSSPEGMRLLERLVLLRAIDSNWVQHLTQMEGVREGIGLRAYGQNDPLVAYKREAFAMYDQLRANIERDVVGMVFHIQVQRQEPEPDPAAFAEAPAAPAPIVTAAVPPARTVRQIRENRSPMEAEASRQPRQAVATAPVNRKVGRNEPCPCGSGKKFKVCHGRFTV